ncbi:MAG: ATP-binding protein [Verrucomicrobia bacterium]|nr:ATP-binding protein [Verrucomicrobiota bacterium]
MKKIRKALESGLNSNPPRGAGFTGATVDAVYAPSSNPMLAHNPFVEALNPTLSGKFDDFFQLLPGYHDEERRRENVLRLEDVERVTHVLQTLSWGQSLYSAVMRVLKFGYLNRNPLKASRTRQMKSAFANWDEMQASVRHEVSLGSVIHSFSIIGTSGVGKTITIEKILMSQPQVIQHRGSYEGQSLHVKQLVWLKLECPHDGTLRGIIVSFFAAVDQVLNTNYFSRFGGEKDPAIAIRHMATVANNHALGLLVIEEVQRLRKKLDQNSLLDFFVQLINTVGAPIILIGTFQALPLVQACFANARRAFGQGDFTWSHLERDSVDWELLTQELWEYQFTHPPTPRSPELDDAFYFHTVGIPDIMVKFYKLLQWEVIGSGDETITVEKMTKVAASHLGLVEPMLRALREKNYKALEEIPDLVLPQSVMKAALVKAQGRIEVKGSANTLEIQQTKSDQNNDQSGPKERIVGILVSLGYDINIAAESARQGLSFHAKRSNFEQAFEEALRIAKMLKRKKLPVAKDSEVKNPSAEDKQPDPGSSEKAGLQPQSSKRPLVTGKVITKRQAKLLAPSERDRLATAFLESGGLLRDAAELFSLDR